MNESEVGQTLQRHGRPLPKALDLGVGPLGHALRRLLPVELPVRAFVCDGIVLREEQAATFKTIEEGVPDSNPMDCQKGASRSQSLSDEGNIDAATKRPATATAPRPAQTPA